MDDLERRAALAHALAQAGAAHGEYENSVLKGEYDQQWAMWYADYLITHDWNKAFTNNWTPSELAQALTQANHDHRAGDTKTMWQDFYAARFAERA